MYSVYVYMYVFTYKVFHDLWTLLQKVIPYAFVPKTFHIYMCPILDGHGVMTA